VPELSSPFKEVGLRFRAKRKTVMTTLVALFALTGTAQAATVPVQSLTPPFAATNPSVTKTPDGVHFGVYFNAGLPGGSLVYAGVNGTTFGSLTALGYTYNYNTSDDNPLGSPYLRVFLDSDDDGDADDDVIFDPTLCATASPPENTDNVVDVTTQTVRYDDDSCSGSPNQQPFATVQAAHAAKTIVGILVSQGDAGGVNASAYLRNLTVNGDTFAFNVPPADGRPGAQGPPGVTTTIVTNTAVAPSPTAGAACVGAKVRRLHAPRIRGELFLRVRAGLMTATGFRPLKARRRRVSLNLRNKPEGNYNVRLISFYRTRSGKVHRVVTRRHFSVACA
jgi:hypothetical protein